MNLKNMFIYIMAISEQDNLAFRHKISKNKEIYLVTKLNLSE